MSLQTLRDNKAIVLFGHPAGNETVAEAIKSLGLNLLRASPSDCKTYVGNDIVQDRYGFFKEMMPVFARASITEGTEVTNNGGYPIRFDWFKKADEDMNPPMLLPTTLPWVVLYWHQRGEQWELAKQELEGLQETVSNKQHALMFKGKDWFDYDKLKGRGISPIAATTFGKVNLNALSYLRTILAVITSIFHAIRYPAFVDYEHESLFLKEKGKSAFEPKRVTTKVTSADPAVADKYEEHDWVLTTRDSSFPEHVSTRGITHQKVSYQGLPGACYVVDITDSLTTIPPGYGLFFPYYRQLAESDSKTVPGILKRYASLSFGSTIETSLKELDEAISKWGMLESTDTGKELSHMSKVLEIAIEAQSKPIALVRDGSYVGCVIIGAGFLIRYHNELVRPVPYNDLLEAIKKSDVHRATLNEIATYAGEEDKAVINRCKSMVELAVALRSIAFRSSDVPRIKDIAKHLDFKHPFWQPNIHSLERAFDAINDPAFTLKSIKEPSMFPLHPSQLFETDIVHNIWSCFGHWAPSFDVPMGTLFNLREDMSFKTGGASSSSRVEQSLIRITMRVKPLEQALKDIDWVKESQSIRNPVSAPRGKASQQHIDKNFSGPEGRVVIGLLRRFVGISSGGSGKGKRKADEDLGGDDKRKKDESAIDLEW
ncbi:hypothetical protein [Tulasnella ambivirus 1]|uniref:Uncharacterized protein n=1 Tax=Tulasnella ambivirus 1 TaxID=2772289 RepID=A0A7S8BDN0_9VIRU|nr:hypothetical protein [Tulasnella ambivirus 1]